VPSNGDFKKNSRMGMPVVSIDGQKVWRRQVAFFMCKCGAPEVEIMNHPAHGARIVQLDVSTLQSGRTLSNEQTVSKPVRTKRLPWQQFGKSNAQLRTPGTQPRTDADVVPYASDRFGRASAAKRLLPALI
jgi:hypothetical protein